jgi:hypothetical protein
VADLLTPDEAREEGRRYGLRWIQQYGDGRWHRERHRAELRDMEAHPEKYAALGDMLYLCDIGQRVPGGAQDRRPSPERAEIYSKGGHSWDRKKLHAKGRPEGSRDRATSTFACGGRGRSRGVRPRCRLSDGSKFPAKRLDLGRAERRKTQKKHHLQRGDPTLRAEAKIEQGCREPLDRQGVDSSRPGFP